MMPAVNQLERKLRAAGPGAALIEEIRQLKGLRRLRLKSFGPGDQEIDHLDEMIHERLVRLLAI